MTFDEARVTATNAAMHFGKPFVIFRLPAWVPESYGVVPQDRDLPREAILAETCYPPGRLF